ncbi:MAG: hypothetical protein JEZ08_04405 [Clostridiales bacterium]|nr:hypothetical protein [Clostridiales bacterium]
MNLDNIYWIGGSPCCGKSSVAEKLIKEYGFKYYKCDDFLEHYIAMGVKRGSKLMKTINKRTQDETWMRDVSEQVEEEFEFYRYALTIIIKDLKKYNNQNVVVEGAALLPEFAQKMELAKNRYICMTPSREFQMEKYKERKWVKYYLRTCSNWEQAFDNWMARDVEFARMVKNEAAELDFNTLTIDGQKSIDEVYQEVKTVFELE